MSVPVAVARVYRVEYADEPRYVIERNAQWRLVDGNVFGAYTEGQPVASTGLRLLAPVSPSKIVAVGLNYRDHAAELQMALPDEPMIFLKPSTAVIGPDAPIVIPPGVGRVDHEAELGIVIRDRAHCVPAQRAHEHVLGLTCVNDVTARDLQHRDTQFTRCKGFDTFAPLGPCVAIGLDGGDLDVEGWVNGERRQASNTRQLVFPLEEIVAYVSSIMTLLPGDVIATGTPAGIGPIHAGDRVTVRIPGVGELSNPVVEGR